MIIAFLIGLFCGAFLGMFVMALLSMASKASRAEEKTLEDLLPKEGTRPLVLNGMIDLMGNLRDEKKESK